MYQIKDLAEQTGITSSTIRYYEDIGVLPYPKRADNGYRLYDDADLERVRFVTRARRLGFSLDEISEIIGLRERGETPCTFVVDRISVKLNEIDQQITDLIQLQDDLQQLQAQSAQIPQEAIQGKSCVCHLIEQELPTSG